MECGGQCKAPYELDVGFKPSTTISDAKQAIERCADSPIVIRVATLTRLDGAWHDRIYTTQFLRSDVAQALATCLSRQQVISSTVWPD
jgi:hypothetical protein